MLRLYQFVCRLLQGMSGAAAAQHAVLGASEAVPDDTPVVRGYEFPVRSSQPGSPAPPVDFGRLLAAMATTGFQATALGAAVAEVKRMLAWRLSHEALPPDADAGDAEPTLRDNTRCKARGGAAPCEAARASSQHAQIFLGFTSNLISSGVRESVRYLAQNRMVDVIVTTAGGVEEDIIKVRSVCYLPRRAPPDAFASVSDPRL